MKANVKELNERMANVKFDLRDTRLILENEIRVNIQFAVRVSVLETELRRIKRQPWTA